MNYVFNAINKLYAGENLTRYFLLVHAAYPATFSHTITGRSMFPSPDEAQRIPGPFRTTT